MVKIEKDTALAAIAAIPTKVTAYGRQVNPATGSPAISNFPTQVVANRPVSGEVTISDGKTKATVKVQNWQPARVALGYNGDDAGGNTPIARSAAGDIMALYAMGKVSNPDQECLHLIAYFALSVLTGRLPTPDADSWENCSKAAILAEMLRIAGLTVDSATAVTSRGKMTYNGGILDAMIQVCKVRIAELESWAPKTTRRKATGKVNFL